MKTVLQLSQLHCLIMSFLISSILWSQNNSCANAEQICSNIENVESITGEGFAESGPDYGCLGLEPRPRWYFMEISQAGLLEFDLVQYNIFGDGIDIDYIVWGPFNNLNGACNQLTAANIADCSYSATAFEVVSIPNVQVGEIYIMLITNFDGQQGTFDLTPTSNNTAATDCSFACNVTLTGDECHVPSTLTATSNVNLDIINYTWSLNGNVIGTTPPQNNTFQATQAGTYSVSMETVNPQNGSSCTATSEFVINTTPPVNGSFTVCQGEPITLHLNALSGSNLYWYASASGGSPIHTGNDFTTPPINSATSYYVEQELNNCRSVRSEIVIDIVIPPNAGGNGSITLCNTNEAINLLDVLSGNPNENGNWSPSLASGSGVFDPFIDSEGTYTYTVPGTAPCADRSAQVEVIVHIQPEAGSDNSVEICANEGPIDLFNLLGPEADTGGDWTPTLSSGSGIFDPALDASGIYTYTVYGEDPCIDKSAQVDVTILPIPILYDVSYGNGYIRLFGAQAEPPYQYNINNGPYSPNNEFHRDADTYLFGVLSANGCESEKMELPIITLQNTITPNGDGRNDSWKIKGIELLDKPVIFIYDRYGKMIYENHPNPYFEWFGDYLGRSLPTSSYWYIMQFETFRGTPMQFNGYIFVKNRNTSN